MESPNRLTRRFRDLAALGQRVSELEAEVQECRQLNLRLAELCDVMMELLVPVTGRDEEAVAEIMERYRTSVSDPIRWKTQ